MSVSIGDLLSGASSAPGRAPALSSPVLAHGGTYGALAEGAIALSIAGFLAWIWLSERRRRRREGRPRARMRE